MAFNPELGSTSPAVLLDNAERLDKLVNGPELTEPDRAGVDLDTWRGMMAKNDQVTEDARKSITALGLPYSTLSEAQAAVNNGQIPVDSVCYVRSTDDAVAIEGLSERAELFTISYFKELDSVDWLCEGINRGSKPRFTEKRADPRRM